MQVSVLEKKIFETRGQKVLMDFDLTTMYEAETKVFNQAIQRNATMLSPNFIFTPTQKEFQGLRSQIVNSTKGGTRYLT